MTRPLERYASRPYPGTIPEHPYVVVGGRVAPLRWPAARVPLPQDPVALLAYGSNACPGRLAEKFGSGADGIVVLPAALHGARRVYAHLPHRGTLPYTLRDAPAHREAAHVVVVPARLGHAMDVSEGREIQHYDLARLDDVVVQVGGLRWPAPLTYLGKADRGPASWQGRPMDVSAWRTPDADALVDELRGDDGLLPGHEVVPADVPLADARRAQDRELLGALAAPTRR
ncbi:hypothetical protein [Cellulomonas sp. PhB143]|uniref:hypothetical protein n=1 Tax=Cellulomonas sp. PhB143 TaxID=2485186 RepID=UPI000F4819D3|nr:hypothetical protein [Cellulomonas sp. PhB143]ROS76632.1 hypothetical protein EDF32_1453 [Cellulomonas sp. PhB143]